MTETKCLPRNLWDSRILSGIPVSTVDRLGFELGPYRGPCLVPAGVKDCVDDVRGPRFAFSLVPELVSSDPPLGSPDLVVGPRGHLDDTRLVQPTVTLFPEGKEPSLSVYVKFRCFFEVE